MQSVNLSVQAQSAVHLIRFARLTANAVTVHWGWDIWEWQETFCCGMVSDGHFTANVFQFNFVFNV